MFVVCGACSCPHDTLKDKVCPNPACPLKMKFRDEDISNLLHRLWDKAVGTEDYDKTEWMKLSEMLYYRGIRGV